MLISHTILPGFRILVAVPRPREMRNTGTPRSNPINLKTGFEGLNPGKQQWQKITNGISSAQPIHIMAIPIPMKRTKLKSDIEKKNTVKGILIRILNNVPTVNPNENPRTWATTVRLFEEYFLVSFEYDKRIGINSHGTFRVGLRLFSLRGNIL